MDETRRTNAIIIRRSPYRESDLLLTAYTEAFGKLSLVARGAKKLRSKLAGHVEPLVRSDLMVVKGRHYDYAGSAAAVDVYPRLRADLNRLYYAGRGLSWFDRLVKDGEADSDLFLLLRSWLEAIDGYEGKFDRETGALFFSFFTLKMLALLGYGPELGVCLECKQPLAPGKNYFDLRDGGLLCAACFEKRRQDLSRPAGQLRAVSDNAVKLLRFLNGNRFDKVRKLKLERAAARELFSLLEDFLAFRW